MNVLHAGYWNSKYSRTLKSYYKIGKKKSKKKRKKLYLKLLK
jgi:hypothetical protein